MPMPDQTSDPRSGTLFRFGCVEDDEKDGEHAEARSDPGDDAACRHRRHFGRQPTNEHCAGEDERPGTAERQRAHFRVERRRRQRTEQVADEVKRSEQPGGGQAKLQIARDDREHDPIGDTRDADVQTDRKHRDGKQDGRGIPRSRAGCAHGWNAPRPAGWWCSGSVRLESLPVVSSAFDRSGLLLFNATGEFVRLTGSLP